MARNVSGAIRRDEFKLPRRGDRGFDDKRHLRRDNVRTRFITTCTGMLCNPGRWSPVRSVLPNVNGAWARKLPTEMSPVGALENERADCRQSSD